MNLYDVHSWSRQYREQRLAEARTRHLEGQLREDPNERPGRGSLGLALANVLTLVRGA